jgi:hypothetical protein
MCQSEEERLPRFPSLRRNISLPPLLCEPIAAADPSFLALLAAGSEEMSLVQLFIPGEVRPVALCRSEPRASPRLRSRG